MGCQGSSPAQSGWLGFCSNSHRFSGEWGVPWAPFGQDSKLLFTSLIFPLVGWLLFLKPKPLPVSNVPSESRCCCPPDDRGQRLFLPESLPSLQPAVTSSEGRVLLPLSQCQGLVAGPSRSQQDAPTSWADLGSGCFSTNILSALFPTEGKVFMKPIPLRDWVKRRPHRTPSAAIRTLSSSGELRAGKRKVKMKSEIQRGSLPADGWCNVPPLMSSLLLTGEPAPPGSGHSYTHCTDTPVPSIHPSTEQWGASLNDVLQIKQNKGNYIHCNMGIE